MRGLRSLKGLMVLAWLGVGSGLLAQAQPVMAPRIEENGKSYDVHLDISGYGSSDSIDLRPMRTVAPKVPVEQWFGADSALVIGHRDNPAVVKTSRVKLVISPEGTVSACEPTEYFSLPITQEAFCSLVSGQRFFPSLSEEGERLAGIFSVTILASRREVSPDAPRNPLIDDRMPAPAMMPVAAPQLVPTEFPPPSWWARQFYREPADWKQRPQAGWQKTPVSSLAIGLVATHQNGVQGCTLVRRSLDADRDQAACALVLDELKPVWADEAQGPAAVPLWIVGDVGAMEAIGPAEEPRSRAQVTPESAAALSAALMNAGVFPAGEAKSDLRLVLVSDAARGTSDCRILETSGSDQGDVDACRLARATLVVLPWQDIFGADQPRNSGYWQASKAER